MRLLGTRSGIPAVDPFEHLRTRKKEHINPLEIERHEKKAYRHKDGGPARQVTAA